MRPTTQNALDLMHEGALALAEIEAVGMRIDVDRLDRTILKVGKRIERLTDELKQDDVWKVWLRLFGPSANMGSGPQLGRVLFDELGYKSIGITKIAERPIVSEKALARLDVPFVKRFLQVEKLKKLRATYLMGVKREVVDGFLHPFFNLHLARTYRSSSSEPNFQNVPIRDERIGKLIRTCFIPRDGHVLVEIDYGALEFKVAACFWRDKGMVAYASDPAKDVHRDMAAECYMLPPDKVPSQSRFYAKNQFVFPELYGSYYVNCARNLWNAVDSAGLQTEDGVGLYDHLRTQGITKLGDCDSQWEPVKGTYEWHVRKVEQRFKQRFPEWDERKERWWERYQREGWLRTMTGFVCTGVYNRNNVMNYPIQGPAFHCLLWSLIRLVRWLRKSKMRSVVVGQIHDSIVADVHRNELDDFLATAKCIMTEDIRKEWKWIIVPFEVEAKVASSNWFEQETVEL